MMIYTPKQYCKELLSSAELACNTLASFKLRPTCKPLVYLVGWIGGWALSVLLPRRGVGPRASSWVANPGDTKYSYIILVLACMNLMIVS